MIRVAKRLAAFSGAALLGFLFLAYAVGTMNERLPLSELPEETRDRVFELTKSDHGVYLQTVVSALGYDPIDEEVRRSRRPGFRRLIDRLDEGLDWMALTMGLYTANVESAPGLDAEGTMTVVERNYQGTNRPHSILAFMRRLMELRQDGNQQVLKFQIRTARVIQSTPFWTYSSIPYVAPYNRQGDPVLDCNPFTTGVSPKRVYLASLQFQADETAPYPTLPLLGPGAILVHRSDDGGATWLGPATAAVNVSPNFSIDKPDMVVSYHPGTQGYVYLTYTRIPRNCPGGCPPDQIEIYITRSTNGGVNFQTPTLLVVGDVNASQVIVSPFGGRVYVFWVDEASEQIKMRYTDNCCSAASFSATEVAASGIFYTSANPVLRYFPSANGGDAMPARTIPQARYDWINNRLLLTWHEAEFRLQGAHTGINNTLTLVDANANFTAAGISVDDWVHNTTDGSNYLVSGIPNPNTLNLVLRSKVPGAEGRFDTGDQYVLKRNRADVYYATKTTAGWQPKVLLPLNNRSDDQVMPSVDFDGSGQIVIAFNDRSATGQAFQPRWIQFNAQGSKTGEGNFPNASSNNAIDNGAFSFIGDYTDTFYFEYPVLPGVDPWGPRYHYIFTGRPAGTEGNIYAGAVN